MSRIDGPSADDIAGDTSGPDGSDQALLSEGVLWNPITHNWHLRAPWRAQLAPAGDTSQPCPFCPGGSESPPAVGTHIVSSRFPFIAPPPDASYEPHRVLFFSPDHERNLDALAVAELVAVLERVSAECSELLTHDAVQSVYTFQASGPLFGGSLSHPHLQVLGFPFVPANLVPDMSHGCPLCGCSDGDECVISRTADLALVVPPWSRVPYEMVIAPRLHVGTMNDCDTAQIADLLFVALRAAKELTPGQETPYTLNFMAAPKDPIGGAGRLLHPSHHFRIEIIPFATDAGRIRQVLAIEFGMGVVLNTTAPADAALRLRRASMRLRGEANR